MKVNIHKHNQTGYPAVLANIYDPPGQLYWTGAEPASWLDLPRVGIVGSRKPTTYGRQVTYKFSSTLAARGVVIISGLAFGIDSIAHQAVIEAGGLTVAVLPGSLEQIYPASHRALAEKILRSGGTLVSEYPPGTEIRAHNFIARNRIISGLSDALLITQAGVKSGSLHTANFAIEQGKTVMCVPGDITVALNEGSNNLIKGGGLPVTTAEDVIFALGLNLQPTKSNRKIFQGSAQQQLIFDLIRQGVSDQEELAVRSRLDSAVFSTALTMLEISGYIRASGAGQWTIA
ncbi:TPA: DNA-protecting protein DprA [Candidatus Saccharibacteria bacterium]|nr:MAG: protecting protein DprA protein [Candidatus Saccharibacteria bacterium GW2011_GWA2_46_10]OGL34960.1 MAG: DNA protecting protein DprA [Candidatus Saccharibacteria bacterium RIFCSPHIGHO2_12_FULL_47_17]HCM51779.1 DNA-protecting protein DprA [Candidatus Saccharibacteria bacterium]